MSMDRLIDRIIKTKNPTVVGLDPKLEFIPEHIKKEAFDKKGETLKGAAYALWLFNKGLIDALCDTAPAIKPQAAYYEMYGWPGMKTLAKTVAYAKEKGMYVIMDAKRGDIGATMEAYAAAHLGSVAVGKERFAPFDADSLTVNGYLGTDGIAPLMKVCKEFERSIFVLAKTSNPSSGELQDMTLTEGGTVYKRMAELSKGWGSGTVGKHGYSDVGIVVGATYPEQLSELRKEFPNTFFLVPGYGAQGGGGGDVARAFDSKGLGAIVNSSRAILCAWQKDGSDGKDYQMSALKEVNRMKQDLGQYAKL